MWSRQDAEMTAWEKLWEGHEGMSQTDLEGLDEFGIEESLEQNAIPFNSKSLKEVKFAPTEEEEK